MQNISKINDANAPRPTTSATANASSPQAAAPMADTAAAPQDSVHLTDEAAKAARAAETNGGDSRIQGYMLGLISKGVSPQDAAKESNQKFGRTTGNEAVYYADTNTIGLPDCYLAGPTDKPDSPDGWCVVQRAKNGGGASEADMGGLKSAMGMGGMSSLNGLGGDDATQDPDVQKTIQQIKAQGSQVLYAGKHRALG